MSAFAREFFSFIEIAREKSIRRAADKLNISASALSRQMQILEQAFSISLFVRVPQGVQLTAQGELLLAQAQKWLEEEAVLRGKLQNRHQADQFRLGVMECLVPFVAEHIAASAMAVTVRVGTTENLLGQLRRNEIDVMLAFNVPRLPELRLHDERSYELGVAYAPALTPRGQAPYRLEDCLDLPLCLPDQSMSIWPRLEAEIYRLQSEPRIVLRTNSIGLLIDYVAKGAAISLLTALDVDKGLREGLFQFAPLAHRRLSERLSLCSAMNAPLGPQQAALSAAFFKALP